MTFLLRCDGKDSVKTLGGAFLAQEQQMPRGWGGEKLGMSWDPNGARSSRKHEGGKSWDDVRELGKDWIMQGLVVHGEGLNFFLLIQWEDIK